MKVQKEQEDITLMSVMKEINSEKNGIEYKKSERR